MLQILMTTSAAVVMNVSARVQSTEYIPAADPAWEEGAPLYGGEGGVMRLVGSEEDPGLRTVSRALPGDSVSHLFCGAQMDMTLLNRLYILFSFTIKFVTRRIFRYL